MEKYPTESQDSQRVVVLLMMMMMMMMIISLRWKEAWKDGLMED
jgi:hypothetical protein